MTQFLPKGRTIPTKLATALALSALLLTGACGKKKVDELPPAPGYGEGSGVGTYDPYAQGGDDSTGAYDPNAGYNTGGMGGVDTGPGSQADFLRSVPSDRILFDTDRFNVDTADMVVLQAQAQWAMRYPNTMLVIEGHADERGTRDYNLALGERRANSAKQYLVSLGVPSNRIQTVSYGKERPQAMGSDEGSYAQNRRAVTVTVK